MKIWTCHFLIETSAVQRASMVAEILDRFQIVGKKDLYPKPALRGSAAVGRGGSCGHRKSAIDPGRRAHRQLHSSQAKEIMELFKKLNDAGTTIVQVTHSEANAAYGNRTIQLFDGWIVTTPRTRKAPATAPLRSTTREIIHGHSFQDIRLVFAYS